MVINISSTYLFYQVNTQYLQYFQKELRLNQKTVSSLIEKNVSISSLTVIICIFLET
jgi:hypothetical protein